MKIFKALGFVLAMLAAGFLLFAAAFLSDTPSPTRKHMNTLSYGVNFDTNSAQLKAESTTILDQAVEVLNQQAAVSVRVEGHTDSRGTDAYNQRLSVRRAEAVKAYLVSKGIPANRIYTEGKGKRQPVKNCTGGMSKALVACLEPNRRVEVEVVGTRSK